MVQGWGWLTDFLVRLKCSVTAVNRLTDGRVYLQICPFMNVSIFLSNTDLTMDDIYQINHISDVE